MKKVLSIAAFCAVLVGCSNQQGLNSKIGVDRYSGSKTISMPPHGADCTSMQCISIGAAWVGSKKNDALLTISLINTADFIKSAHLEIDGVMYDLRNDKDLTSYDSPLPGSPGYIESRKSFLVPLDLIERITTARKAWIFVSTGSNGVMSDAIIDSRGDSKAYYALKRFLMDVHGN